MVWLIKGAYFGFIRPEEEPSGPYHDFSLVFFPQKNEDDNVTACVVALGVGSQGFANDYEIATLPWVRRLFSQLRRNEAKTYFKNDFSDIESVSLDLVSEIQASFPGLRAVNDKYKTVLPAAEILDFSDEKNDDDNLTIINQWIATYAKLRGWADTKDKAGTVLETLKDVDGEKEELTATDIYKILVRNKFIVLQGAPGTGKTYSALEVAANNFDEKHVHFIQFHAETTYSDFVYGIKPTLNSESLGYEANEGILLKAIKDAQNNKEANVLLIIDEINRANLSNVLGPVFYLFEKNESNHNYKIPISGKDDDAIDKLPDNLYVIATMNTADRRLAVVDFALRRRFTWLTLRPHKLKDSEQNKGIKPEDQKHFHDNYFDDFDRLFEKYATDDELNLQPGHSYFNTKLITSEGIADENKMEEQMKERLKYELMPLIKEYINEGYLTKAKDEFSNYFYNKLGVLMYE